MISKILVPHDGTEMSDKAFVKAVELSKMFRAELVLLHVIEEIPLPTSLIFDDTAVINRERRSLGENWKKDGISWSRLRLMRSKMITWLCAVNVEMGQPPSRSCGSQKTTKSI